MHRLLPAAVLAISLGACVIDAPNSGDDAGVATTTCVAPLGLYQLSYQEVSGTCGAQSPVNVVFDGTKQALATGCTTGSVVTSGGGCTDTLQLGCTPLAGQTIQKSGTVDWTSDGKTAHGVVSLSLVTLTTNSAGEVTDTSVACSSTYNVTYAKI